MRPSLCALSVVVAWACASCASAPPATRHTHNAEATAASSSGSAPPASLDDSAASKARNAALDGAGFRVDVHEVLLDQDRDLRGMLHAQLRVADTTPHVLIQRQYQPDLYAARDARQARWGAWLPAPEGTLALHRGAPRVVQQGMHQNVPRDGAQIWALNAQRDGWTSPHRHTLAETARVVAGPNAVGFWESVSGTAYTLSDDALIAHALSGATQGPTYWVTPALITTGATPCALALDARGLVGVCGARSKVLIPGAEAGAKERRVAETTTPGGASIFVTRSGDTETLSLWRHNAGAWTRERITLPQLRTTSPVCDDSGPCTRAEPRVWGVLAFDEARVGVVIETRHTRTESYDCRRGLSRPCPPGHYVPGCNAPVMVCKERGTRHTDWTLLTPRVSGELVAHDLGALLGADAPVAWSSAGTPYVPPQGQPAAIAVGRDGALHILLATYTDARTRVRYARLRPQTAPSPTPAAPPPSIDAQRPLRLPTQATLRTTSDLIAYGFDLYGPTSPGAQGVITANSYGTIAAPDGAWGQLTNPQAFAITAEVAVTHSAQRGDAQGLQVTLGPNSTATLILMNGEVALTAHDLQWHHLTGLTPTQAPIVRLPVQTHLPHTYRLVVSPGHLILEIDGEQRAKLAIGPIQSAALTMRLGWISLPQGPGVSRDRAEWTRLAITQR